MLPRPSDYKEADEDLIPVCKVMFLNTLNISDRMVRTALGKVTQHGTMEGERRGGRKKTETDDDKRDAVRAHLSRFPRTESHYCGKSADPAEYLSTELNIKLMHRIYMEEYGEQQPVSEAFYRKEFHQMSLKFHRPKKTSVHFVQILGLETKHFKTRMIST